MIQELLSSVVEVDNRTKLSHIPSNLTSSPSQSATSSPTSSSSDTTITANAANNQNNLRCPRCDSSNTKFCYYNNYNLTQPRHFCKTCRRYWTKGGALRNVPIGGGCRKTKSAVAPPSIVKSSAAMPSCTKPKTMTSLDIMSRAGPDVLLPSSPILWAGMPHSSHLLALLRASQMQQNPSFLNSVRVKEEGGGGLDANCGGMNLENFGGFPVNAGGAPLWRSTESQYPFMSNHHQVQQAPPTQSLLLSEVPTSSGIQELYQRLKSSTMGSYGGESEQFQGIVGSNVGVATSMGSGVNVASSSSVMDPIPLTGGEFGYWNPTMAWSDLSTANRAFP